MWGILPRGVCLGQAHSTVRFPWSLEASRHVVMMWGEELSSFTQVRKGREGVELQPLREWKQGAAGGPVATWHGRYVGRVRVGDGAGGRWGGTQNSC